MLVSHDRALLREVCDEFWLVSEGTIKPFDGDLDDYQQWLLDNSREMARQAKEATKGGDKAGSGQAEEGRCASRPRRQTPRIEEGRPQGGGRRAPAARRATEAAAQGVQPHRQPAGRVAQRTRQASKRRSPHAAQTPEQTGRSRQAPEGGRRRDRDAGEPLARTQHRDRQPEQRNGLSTLRDAARQQYIRNFRISAPAAAASIAFFNPPKRKLRWHSTKFFTPPTPPRPAAAPAPANRRTARSTSR